MFNSSSKAVFVLNRMDFYLLLQNENEILLDQFYITSSNENLASRDKKLKIKEIKQNIMQNLLVRNKYCYQNIHLDNYHNELLLIIKNLEKILFDMVPQKIELNYRNLKFTQMFLTILSNYLTIVYSFENSTMQIYSRMKPTLETIFSRIE